MYDSMVGSEGHYASEWARDKNMYCILFSCRILKKKKKQLIDTENRLMDDCQGQGTGRWTKWIKVMYKLQIRKQSWGCNVQHGVYPVNKTVLCN